MSQETVLRVAVAVSTRHMVPFLYCCRSTTTQIGELGLSGKYMFAQNIALRDCKDLSE
jgi:hypothetical protein